MTPRTARAQADMFDQVEHHYVDNNGVSIHYVSAGQGPLVVDAAELVSSTLRWWLLARE